MRKVRISVEKMYFKEASVEIEIPESVDQDNLAEWLWGNEHQYDWRLKNKLVDTKHELLDGEVWRYDELDSEGIPTYGGHL
jgi:hypothetical protein